MSCDVIVRWCDGDEERYDAIARPAITPLAKEQDDRDDITSRDSAGVVASTTQGFTCTTPPKRQVDGIQHLPKNWNTARTIWPSCLAERVV